MKLEITCTRAQANHKQIFDCMSSIKNREDSFENISKLLSITGSKVRLKILFLLNKEQELCPCDLADILKMSVPAISQHIRKIKDAKIITARRDGQTLYYSLNEDNTYILDNIFKSLKLERKIA